jgi:DNA-binding NarL/FixJ family response regulator
MHPSLPDLTEARRRFTDLSTAERANLRFLARGWTPDEIARHRLVTLNTVRSQIKTMLRRLETDCTLRAVTIYHLARDPQWGLP